MLTYSELGVVEHSSKYKEKFLTLSVYPAHAAFPLSKVPIVDAAI